MTVRACIVIPVYNHGHAVGRVAAALSLYRLPMIVVDDGSDEATRARLIQLAAEEPLVQLLRLPRNQGKGGAVMTALRAAHVQGFTHALQIDADGQHDTADVPKFLAVAEAHPRAVICGEPLYDSSVPSARRYGRYLTHLWVWVETLSLQIKDSMCGLRVYPLALALRVIDTAHIPRRMDFDIAILVRLAWSGAAIVNIKTRVTYPSDGVSHFDMLCDNLRISATHARLVVGMLLRLPWLLRRRLFPRARSGAHWSRLAERGSMFGILVVFYTYRVLGRSAARALLYPVATYFFVVAHRARRASLDYLRRVYACTSLNPALPRPPTWRDGLRHVLAFAQASLDKVAAWQGSLDRMEMPCLGTRELDALIAAGSGAVLIGAHLGNWEMARAVGSSRGHRSINAVIYTEHAQRFNRVLGRINNRFQANLIQISSLGPDTAIRLKEKIDRGEVLMIVGDRTPPAQNGRVVSARFLGQEAPFPIGPFLLAALLECPVYLFFCLREAQGYRVHLEPFSERVRLPRRDREAALRGYVQRYAQRLEYYCQRAPFQWFNFYDFWHGVPAGNPQPEVLS